MNSMQLERIEKIKNHYDFEDQRNMMAEECAELIQAIMKLKRCGTDSEKARNAYANFAEEVADVLIVAEQMKMYIGAGVVDLAVNMKIERTLNRIAEEELVWKEVELDESED